MDIPHLHSMIFDQPHLFHPGKAETIIRVLGPRLSGAPFQIINAPGGVDHTAFANGRPSAGIIGDRMGRAYKRSGVLPFDMVDGVAIVPIEGTLVHKGAWVGAESGNTSYQGLRAQIDRAAENDIKAVVFEVDSYGGMVSGSHETAEAILKLSRAKPTLAILTDYAYSAGYLLASQARSIVMPEFGGAGSIGVVIMHVDYSGKLDQEGIKVTFVHSGAYKIDGNPYQALPPAVRDRWQQECDALRERFAEQVGKGRSSRFSKKAALATNAQVFDAKEALKIGLVDAIGDVHEAFKLFVAEVNSSGR